MTLENLDRFMVLHPAVSSRQLVNRNGLQQLRHPFNSISVMQLRQVGNWTQLSPADAKEMLHQVICYRSKIMLIYTRINLEP